MKYLSAFAVLGCAAVCAAGEIPFYIGTYTSEDGSQGIYRAVLDTDSGVISEPTLAAKASGPSFLALHPNGEFLYAVESPETVSAFAVGADGMLDRLNSESSHGAGPCHVSVDRAGKNLLVANYGGGSLACLPIKADGSLAEATTVFENRGSGPNPKRQTKPHLHAIYPDSTNRFVYACDLGTDEVLVFEFDAETGKLNLAEPRSAKVPAGGGPRHLALHPDGRFAFANNELTSSVTAFERDPKTGALTPLQTISTLPEGKAVPGNSTAEIFLHPNGRWLYVSNRGHDSIAAYQVGDDGQLSVIEMQAAGVSVPRGFGIDPSGRWLVVGGQKSNDLTALAIDPESGELAAGPNMVAVGQPVCVVFTESAKVAESERAPLEFYIVESEPAEGLTKVTVARSDELIYLHSEPAVTSEDVESAGAAKDNNGKPAIHLTFTPEGGKKLKQVTTANQGKRLAIVVNGTTISAPIIAAVTGKEGVISGRFSREEAETIAESISAAAGGSR